MLRSVVLDPLQADPFVWKWSADGKYSASSIYRAFFASYTSLLGATELWKTKAPPRVKFFLWLALHRRLWTVERRKRHGLQDDDACVLCGQAPKTSEHLFLGCVIARELWFSLLAPIGLSTLVPEGTDDVGSWWLRQRQRLDIAARPTFDLLTLLISWNTWKERNNRTFAGVAVGTHVLFRVAVSEAEDWVQAGFRTLSAVCAIWSQNSAVM